MCMTNFKVGSDVREIKHLSDNQIDSTLSQMVWVGVAIITSSLLSHIYLTIIR